MTNGIESRPRLATALATRSALAHSRANTARTLRLVPRPDFAGRESRRVGSRTLRGAVVRDVCCFVGSFGVLAFAIFSFFFADPGKQIYATDPVFFLFGHLLALAFCCASRCSSVSIRDRDGQDAAG